MSDTHYFLILHDNILDSRDETLVSRESGNLHLTGTVGSGFRSFLGLVKFTFSNERVSWPLS